MDVEGQPESTPLRMNQILLRRSTTAFSERQPREGVLGILAAFCCSLIFSLIVLALFNGLSIAAIVIGAIYLGEENCPGSKNLADVLIASGCLAIIYSIFQGRTRIQVAKDGEEVEQKKDCCYWLLNLASIVQFGLFIYICVLVFNLYPNVRYEPDTHPIGEQSYYCNPTLFLFAFWTTIFTFVCLGIWFAFILCCCCCIAITSLILR